MAFSRPLLTRRWISSMPSRMVRQREQEQQGATQQVMLAQGGAAGSAISLVVETDAFANNAITTPPVNTTGSDLLIVSGSWYSNIGSSVSDSKSNTWYSLTAQQTSPIALINRLFYASSAISGTGHTATLSGVSNFGSIGFQAWSGISPAPFDVENGSLNNTSGLTSIQTGSVTPSQNNCLIVASIVFESGGTLSIDSGFTLTRYGDPSGERGGIAYLIQDTAAAVNPTWSISSNFGPYGAAATIAVFKGL